MLIVFELLEDCGTDIIFIIYAMIQKEEIMFLKPIIKQTILCNKLLMHLLWRFWFIICLA